MLRRSGRAQAGGSRPYRQPAELAGRPHLVLGAPSTQKTLRGSVHRLISLDGAEEEDLGRGAHSESYARGSSLAWLGL